MIGKIKDLVQSRKLQGIADVRDLTDREHGLQLVIEVKNGFNAEAILDQLYRLTPMEDTFGVNNVALVDGQPLTLGLKELLEVYVDHRFDVVRRRSTYRRRRREEQLHLVQGRLIAILDIDEVIAVIRISDDTAGARARLMEVFDLSEIQANDILELPLRRLTKFSRLELEKERDQLTREIAELTAILESDDALAHGRFRRARRGREEIRHAAANRSCSSLPALPRSRGATRGHRRSVPRAALAQPACLLARNRARQRTRQVEGRSRHDVDRVDRALDRAWRGRRRHLVRSDDPALGA